MARRSEHTQDELKEMAIKAGYRLLEDRGLKDFSARAVAASMGYTVGTLYHLFGTLDNFILNINARTLDDWYDFTTAGTKGNPLPKDPAKNPAAAVRYFAQSYLAYARKNYNRWSALFEHRMQDDAPVPGWYMPKMLRMFAQVEQTVLPLTGDPESAARLAKLLWAGVHGVCTLALAGKLEQVQADPAERMIDDLIALAAAPLQKKNRPG